MMKKNGFTLAEVLITLAIIGVVATMTLPALMTNTQEQQARTGLKKGINTITEAAQMNQALEGWDFASTLSYTENEGAVTSGTNLASQSFQALVASRMNVDYRLGSALPTNGPAKGSLSGYKAVYLRDGAAIYYNNKDVAATNANAALLDDGLPVGFVVFYDTNGQTGPNILSNCATTSAPLGTSESQSISATSSSADFITAADAATACSKSKRVVKDIFAVRIRGSHAQPEGNASTWLLNGDVKASGS